MLKKFSNSSNYTLLPFSIYLISLAVFPSKKILKLLKYYVAIHVDTMVVSQTSKQATVEGADANLTLTTQTGVSKKDAKPSDPQWRMVWCRKTS
jgi:hypothetical protein